MYKAYLFLGKVIYNLVWVGNGLKMVNHTQASDIIWVHTTGFRQNNQWQTAWGYRYYVGADGRAVQGHQMINNHHYYFGNNGTFYLR